MNREIFNGARRFLLLADLARARTSAANLADANVRLQSFAVDLEEFSAGEERFRIARVFHDTLGHCLTAALMQIQASAELYPVAPERAGVKLQLARKMWRKAWERSKRS